MKFSVIMASRLADYPSSAKEKESKLIRAVNSVTKQTFKNWELLVIADGCKKTAQIVTKFFDNEKIRLFEVAHQRLWSGIPRNTGIDNAEGDFMVYLDIDDIYGPEHLQIISEDLDGYDWIWYNDYRYKPKENFWYENHCDVRQLGMCGTSNICHKKFDVRWNENDRYAHDFHFIQKLMNFKNHTKTRTPEYFVCHIPGTQVSGGYDL